MANSNDNNKNYKLSQFRRNYFFYGKLMAVRDFEVEQGYMNEKRHLLTRLTSGTGIVCGLDGAEVYTDEENVKIKFKTGGFAVDYRGREIVVPADSDRQVYIKEGQTKVNLTRTDLETSLYYVYLEYNPVFAEPVNSAANPSSCEETCCPNRVIEDFELVASTNDPGTTAIVCPDLSEDTVSGTAKEKIKKWLREESSRMGSPGDRFRVFLLALESASGEVSVNVEETAPYLSFVFNSKLFAELLTCHLSDFGNPHKITAKDLGALKSVDGVGNPGGDVDLVKDNSITITPDDAANTITIGETHSARTDNPHGTTAVQLGALSSVDGVSNPGGNVDLVAESSIDITPNNGANTITIGETHSAKTGNPHRTKHEDIKDVLPVFGDADNDVRNKHVSNKDAEKWNNAAAEAGLNSIDGVDNPGGNIDLVGQNAIEIVPDNVAKSIVINENHSTNTDNPHNTTAGHVGALSAKGGIVEGDVTVNGNVGIGTTNPLEMLHINGSVRGNIEGSLRISTGNGYVDIGPQNPLWSHFLTDRPLFYFDKGITVDSGCIGSYNENLQLQTSGKTRITIRNDNGNVGIGTTNPLETLHINGSVRGNIDGALRISTGFGYVDIGSQSTPWVHFQTDRPRFYFEKGITVDSGCIGSYNEDLQLQTSGKTRITIVDDNGYVGIGTPDPQYHLHTNGTSYANYRAGGGIDYAEYFESKNGKDIKPGTSVVLDGDKIRPAKENEIPIGVISASPGIVGGVHVEWPKKYLKDKFGSQIMEKYKKEIMAPKKQKVKKERQKMEKKKVKETITKIEIACEDGKYFQKEIKETVKREIEEPVFKEVDLYDIQKKNIIGKHRIPVMETYEEEIDVLDEEGQAVLVGSGKFETKTRPKINPEYDETKEYIPREKRPEWNCVGLLGQLPLQKGQPVAPGWVKIKDLAKDVELWLVK
ncbi:MAG: hypothetical protein GTO45_30665 [Candidatus Aminicenantes bacterium]|nr:hypothetical protein [Candidatus Aminicenantes bacterium]NIM83155.1 hypothetical protein [Candidatus Aminicenantes bacterium]NIN22531.1 hypothetical protein [Candidatus Aminicenantes bacterium]NIN46302.1 hypothetical protein [Candidatus Aminicenantes bacterium]NIN89141.1 hypothetical protein [Candidatus Aminicenantes bacterium]